jgi:hypothetical protein
VREYFPNDAFELCGCTEIRYFISRIYQLSLTAGRSALFGKIWNRGGYLIRCSLDNVTLVSSTASFVSSIGELLQNGWELVQPQSVVFRTLRDTGTSSNKVRAIFMQMYNLPGEDNQGTRIEFNPNYISVDEVVEHISFLTSCNQFRLSRLDIAFDILNEYDLHDFVIDLPRVKRNVYTSSAGKLETLYLGAPKSNKRVRIYDKRLERLSAGYSELQLPSMWWRVEVQLRADYARDWVHCVEPSLPVFVRSDSLDDSSRLISIGFMSGSDMDFLSTKKLRTWRSKICSAQTDLRDKLVSAFNDNVHQLYTQINTLLDNFEFESVQVPK